MTWEERLLAEGYVIRDRFASRAPSPALRPRDAEAAGAMTEGTLLAEVRALAKRESWEFYHTFDSRRSEYGWPDCALCDGTTLLLYELKTNTGKLTMEQQRWLSLLQHCGTIEAGIWRPRDLPQIEQRLRKGC